MAWPQYSAASVSQIASATSTGHTMSHSILGCSRLASPFRSAVVTLSIGFSPRRSLPHLGEPLDRHGHGCLQLLRKELHAQLLEQPTELLEPLVGLAGSDLLLLLALPLREERRELRGEPRVALGVRAQLVQPQGHGLQVAGKVLEPLVRRALDEALRKQAGGALLHLPARPRERLRELLDSLVKRRVLGEHDADQPGDLLSEKAHARARFVAAPRELRAGLRQRVLHARPVKRGGEQLRA